MNKPSLYQRIRRAGIPYASHESDLYVAATPEAKAILADFPLENSNRVPFRHSGGEHDGELWYDIPFAYEPWWTARQSKAVTA